MAKPTLRAQLTARRAAAESWTDPLADRPGLYTEGPETNTLARELGQLAERHRLLGCVLISFTDGGRVGVNSSGKTALFGAQMEKLAHRILYAIDDGKFEPTDGGKG